MKRIIIKYGVIVFFMPLLYAQNSIDMDKLLKMQTGETQVESKTINITEQEKQKAYDESEYVQSSSIVGKAAQALVEDMAKVNAQIPEHLKRQCAIFSTDRHIYNACVGNHELLYEGNYGLIAKYAIQNKCDFIAGMDNTGLSYLCKNPTTSSCSILSNHYSKEVVSACYKCKGSQKWLAMFAASRIEGKEFPSCY